MSFVAGQKISDHAVLTLDTGKEQSPLVQDPGCIGGGCFKSSKSSKLMSNMVDCTVCAGALSW